MPVNKKPISKRPPRHKKRAIKNKVAQTKKKVNGKIGFFRENYSQSWDYIKESKNYIYFAILIFFIFAFIGFAFPVPEQVIEQILKFIEQLLGQTEDLSTIELIVFIFKNNFQASLLGFIFGVVFGVYPLIVALANGYLVGVVTSISVSGEGFFVLWRLFPHGIFELPAVFISLGMGLKFGSFIFSEKSKKRAFVYYLVSGLRVFLFVVIPLLIFAAIIEGTLISLFA